MRPIYQNGGFIGILGDYDSMEPYVTSTPATISFVSSRSGEFAGSTTVGDTLNIASMGLQYGDIIIVAYECCGTTNKTLSIPGYTTVADLYANDTEDSNFIVAYKFMGVVPDTEIIIPPTQNAADAGAYVLQAYRGVNLDTPFDVTSTTVSLTNTAIPNPPAITPVTQGAKIVVAAGAAHTGGTGAVFLAGYLSNFITTAGNDTNDATAGMGHVDWPGVTTYDPAAWSFTGTNSTNFSTNSVTMALRPGFELGNKKNSGIWNLVAERRTKTSGKSAGEVEFTMPGTYDWVVPIGVTSISAVVVGAGGGGGARGGDNTEAGGGGGGGGLAYANLIETTPGETLTVIVGAGGIAGQTTSANGTNGSASTIQRNSVDLILASGGAGGNGGPDGAVVNGGTATIGTGTTGGSGGAGGGNNNTNNRGGGGGAAGYLADGGNGGSDGANGLGSTDGGGGGGGRTNSTLRGGGGGVGLYGTGNSSTGGTATTAATGGSSGQDATYSGGLYGGGGSGASTTNRTNSGADGAVRIIWGPYSFPSDAPSGITGVDVNFGIVYPTYIKQF